MSETDEHQRRSARTRDFSNLQALGLRVLTLLLYLLLVDAAVETLWDKSPLLWLVGQPTAAPAPPPAQPSSSAGPARWSGTLFFSTYGGCAPGRSTNINKVSFTYEVGSAFTLGTPVGIACLPGADGLIFAPDGDLLVGGRRAAVFKVNPSTGKFASVETGGIRADHIMLDPDQRQAWVSSLPGTPASIPLAPFAAGTVHPLSGDDNRITTIAWDAARNAYYTSSGAGGSGSFGKIDLKTFTTTRRFKSLPAAHGMTFDPFTGHLMLFGDNHITQIAPGTTPMIVSDVAFSGFQFDQGTVDGNGHLFIASNTGHMVFIDYASTRKVADPSNFKTTLFVMKALDDFAPLYGPGASATGIMEARLHIVSDIQRAKKPTKNLLMILDASGSMNERLGRTTKWRTALEVFKEVIEKLPDDFNVGLRVYSHRHPAKSPKTCTDTELLVPVKKLDRGRMLSAIQQLTPRGETPLVYSVLQTVKDLKHVRGGSVVLITDGIETCNGDPLKASQQLNESGIDITLHIVGFAIQGKQLEQQLTTFAESTGGRYYSAQSGEALARALWIAATAKFPYRIFDGSGKEVAKGEVGAPPEALPPGNYTVVVQAADQELVAEKVMIEAGQETVVKVALKGDRFVLEQGEEARPASAPVGKPVKKERSQ